MTIGRVLLGVILCFFAWVETPRVNGQQRNVVFISVDDLKTTCGFLSEQPGNFLQTIYPDPAKREEIRAVLTPNIDSLAAQGVTFVRCQCPSAACRSSRAAVMTGLRPHDSGISRNQDPYFRIHPTPAVRNAITLPQNLYRNGYYTAGVGKIFHSNTQADQGKSWRHWIPSALGTVGPNVPSEFDPTPRFPASNVEFGRSTQPLPVHFDYVNAQAIGNMVQYGFGTVGETTYYRDQTKPFFLGCGIYRPHLPLYCPGEFLDLFDPDEMAITRSTLLEFRQDIVGLSPPAYARIRANSTGNLTGGCFYELLAHGRLTHSPDGDIEGWKAFIQHYLGCVAFADRCVGRLLNGIANSEHADNTMVVLWSDHGYALGEKMKVHKHAFWAEENDALLIIKDPTTPETAGQFCYSPVGLMDLYRTINSYCDVAVPHVVAGRDLNYLIKNPAAYWDAAPLSTLFTTQHCMVDRSFRYIKYNVNFQEVYDHTVDPDEIDDLVADPEYTDIKTYLNQRMARSLRYDRGRTQRYLMEGNVNDSSGELNHGEVIGEENYAAGISPTSSSLNFTGTTQRVEMPNSLEEDFSIGMWVKTNASGFASDQNWQNGILLLDSTSTDIESSFGISLIGSQVAFGVGETTILGTTIVSDGQWHFIAATRCSASGQMALYVDGVQEAYLVGPAGMMDIDANLRLGEGLSTEEFVGQFDEVNLFNFTMSSADVRQLNGTASVVSQPEQFELVRGNVEAGALDDVHVIDQSALELKSRMHLGNRTFVDVEFEFDVMQQDLSGLVLDMESRAILNGRTNQIVQLQVSMLNYDSGEYEIVANIPVRGDQFNAQSVSVPGEIENYLSDTGQAKAKFIVVAPGARGSVGELHFDKLALISEHTP